MPNAFILRPFFIFTGRINGQKSRGEIKHERPTMIATTALGSLLTQGSKNKSIKQI